MKFKITLLLIVLFSINSVINCQSFSIVKDVANNDGVNYQTNALEYPDYKSIAYIGTIESSSRQKVIISDGTADGTQSITPTLTVSVQNIFKFKNYLFYTTSDFIEGDILYAYSFESGQTEKVLTLLANGYFEDLYEFGDELVILLENGGIKQIYTMLS